MTTNLQFLFRSNQPLQGYVGMHKHSCYELVYYVAGEGETQIAANRLRYTAKQFALIGPLTEHDERHDQATEVICIGFTLHPNHQPLAEGVFTDDPSDSLIPLLHKLLWEFQQQRQRHEDMLSMLLDQLWLQLQRIIAPAPVITTDDRLTYTLKYIDEHFTQHIDFKTLASIAGYSHDHYRHLFKDKIGVSPHQYIIRQRLEYACYLLKHTNQSVTFIAMTCGFASDSQFCNLFRREIGMTAITYRRNQKSTDINETVKRVRG